MEGNEIQTFLCCYSGAAQADRLQSSTASSLCYERLDHFVSAAIQYVVSSVNKKKKKKIYNAHIVKH